MERMVLSVYFLKDNVIINSEGCFRLLKPAAHESYRLSKSYFVPVSSTDSSPRVDRFYWVLWLMHFFSRIKHVEMTCSEAVAWHDVFALLVLRCWNKFETSCWWLVTIFMWRYQTCHKVFPTRLIQAWYNNIATVLNCEICNKLVTTSLYQSC